MIWIDYVIICITVFSSLMSLIHGFVREVLSLVTCVCAFFVANHYYSQLAKHLPNFGEQIVRNGIAIALLFSATLIIGIIVNYIMNSLVIRIGLSYINRILGICFGALRGVLIVAAALFFLDTFTNFSYNQDWQKSQLIPQFNGIIRWCFDYLQNTSNFLRKQ